MRITDRKVLFFIAGLFLLIIAVVSAFLDLQEEGSGTISTNQEAESWTWQNPVTSREISVPSDWQENTSRGTFDAVLTLTHSTGRGVIYLVNERAVGDMSLSEYVGLKKKTLEKETGVAEIRAVPDGEAFYEGKGAKYLGDMIANTNVRVWRGGERHFWRAVALTDPEYRNMEYRAKRIIDSLMQSTSSTPR